MAGFRYIGTKGGGITSGISETFAVNSAHATLLAPGDVVVITGTSELIDGENTAGVDTGNATTANTGVIEAVDTSFTLGSFTETGLLASTAGSVKVRVDQHAEYEVDADATVAVTQVGLNVGINVTTATKSGGLTISNMEIDTATAATTQTLPFKILALREDSAGVLGNRVLVTPNATTASDGAAGI